MSLSWHNWFEGQPLSLELGRWAERRSRDLDDTADDAAILAAWVALLNSERSRGHSELDLREWAGQKAGRPDAVGQEEVWPSLDRTLAVLGSSSLVGDGTTVTPLVLEGEKLAFYRDVLAEERLVARLLVLDRADIDPEVDEDAEAVFRAVFPEVDDAARAAHAALLRRLVVITGGPGTGKTTAVVKVLAALLARNPSLRVGLCAPTGKAATRLEESIREGADRLSITEELRSRLRLRVRTLHRLIGAYGDGRGTRYHQDNRLPYDLVIVDEASMVDLALMDRLVSAMEDSAQLVLVGDRDQLASVEAGAVLADIVMARRGIEPRRSPRFTAAAEEFLGQGEMPACEDDVPFLDAVFALRKNWRFEEQPELASLADALREGEIDAVRATLGSDATSPVRSVARQNLDAVLDRCADAIVASLPKQSELDPASWLEAFSGSWRILCALRSGPLGISGLNRRVEQRLARRGWNVDDEFYAGRPVLVERNNSELGLANGDVGIVLPDAKSTRLRRAWFPGENDARPRSVLVDQLPEHVTAWAMTVHKSQGSEFARVLVVLPEHGHPLLSRELLYTAATRSRKELVVVADSESLENAVKAVQLRQTGFVRRAMVRRPH